MTREKDGVRSNKSNESIQERKAVEMENRRRALFNRSENKQRLRQAHIERKETIEAIKFHQAKKVFDLKMKQSERAHRLAQELSLRKHFELEEFFKRRRTGDAVSSVSSCNAEDMEVKLTERRKQEEEEGKDSKLNSVWPYTDDFDFVKQERQKKLNYKRELQNQMIDNCRRHREREEEKHRERKLSEDIEKALRVEDLEAEKRKKDTAFLLQFEREAFSKARQIWKNKRREILRREYDDILRMVAKKEVLQKSEFEQKTDTDAKKDAVIKTLAINIKNEEYRKFEREEIYHELYLAEKEDDFSNEALKLTMKKKQTAKQLLQDMARHQKAAAERKAKEDAIDAAFGRYLAEERRKLEEKEKRREQVRREKSMRYGNELREIIRKNRIRHSQDDAPGRSPYL
ncbi:trichohyalin-like [Hylaeus volcanicus]|uniref:trichohyalin-like n=1 Tax=Hylaeus volcanicus TaxID=313075 RepID=UPI0023B7B651|nr:trichohyalin-like [Hylaeus volcanicus]XP_053975609.1 trichohyalin-like [Hylaeus volcanicus]